MLVATERMPTAFTCRTSHTSLTMTFRRQPKTSFIVFGRTGRAGERGVASTLFVSEQRTELFQLERALGIRLERVSMNGESFEKSARARCPRMVRLPGEFLRAQIES